MLDSPKARLAERGGLTWAALLVGLQRGWINQLDVVQASVDWLLKHPNADLEPALLLAASEEDDLDDVRAWLEAANEGGNRETPGEATERWRWALLVDLADNDQINDEARLQRLQELYAGFGYPADMANCSPYSVEGGLSKGATGQSPLEAMRQVVSRLERRLFPSGLPQAASRPARPAKGEDA